MTTINKTFLTTALTAASLAAVPALASADHYRMTPQLTKLGDVGTHANDAEDFVPVPSQRFDQIVIVARDGVVPLDGLKVQYTDSSIDQPFARGFLRPGERIVVDVPQGKPIKMLVLDYNERMSSRYGERADARVEVYGQALPVYQPNWRHRGDRYQRNDRNDRYDRRDDEQYDRGYEPAYDRAHQPRPRADVQVVPRFEWRGGVYVRVN